MTVGGLFERILDDAAVFPPGNLPLAQAVVAHTRHRESDHADLVGPFVVAARDLGTLADELSAAARPLAVAMTSHMGTLAESVRDARWIPTVMLAGLEVVVPDGIDAEEAVAAIQRDAPAGVTVFVEIPRDTRRDAFVAELARRGLSAKLRTGGVRAELYPSTSELAESIATLVRHEVPFKATAGLHHALRNTDPETGFDQHGFLNVLVATARAREGESVSAVRAALDERDAVTLAAAVRDVPRDVRASFLSFGTCSIDEPRIELQALGLVKGR